MSRSHALAVPQRPCGPPPDIIGACLDAVSVRGGQLAAAIFTQHDPDRLAAALRAARDALADAEERHAVLFDALSPATEDEIHAETARLLRSWPQEKRGDLAGFGAELGMFLLQHRPSRRALVQAFQTLKLSKVHLPSISEVMEALALAEGRLQAAAVQLGELPDRIARADAILARLRSGGRSGSDERKSEP